MHWLLDVHLRDDNDKKYEKNVAENFAEKVFYLTWLNQEFLKVKTKCMLQSQVNSL